MAMQWSDVRGESVRLLSRLIAADTTNPPGNEAVAVKVLAEFFRAHNIGYEIIEPQDGRSSIIAHLGPNQGMPLYLVSHLDVVAAEPDQWQYPPFGGEVIDGEIWGRGSLDTKQITVMHAITMALLQGHSEPLNRPVIFMGTADEEKGSKWGMDYLVQHQPERFRPGFALNEGGGFTAVVKGRTFYMFESAQKGGGTVKISSTRDIPAHPSCPPDFTPLRSVVQAAHRIFEHKPPVRLGQTGLAMFKGLAPQFDIAPEELGVSLDTDEALVRTILDACDDEGLMPVLRAASCSTLSPNLMSGGTSARQLPTAAEVSVSCRLLPDVTRDDMARDLRTLLEGIDVEVEFEEFRQGYDLGVDNELFQTAQVVISELDPGALVLPFVAIGGTDSRHLRHVDVKSYGFAPMPGVEISEVVKRVHRFDERIPVDSLVFGVEAAYRMVRQLPV